MLNLFDAPGIAEDDLPSPGDFSDFHPFIKGVFSQWRPTPFALEHRTFVCAEQWMMYAKAVLFADAARAEAILRTDDPAEHKRHGQLVNGFSHDVWLLWRVPIVHAGNHAKFAQNPGALRQLRATAPAMLVEANPRDWNWGVGLAVDDPAARDPTAWKGLNLLGRVLTRVRQELSS
jgi:ribA/ribD-fused uncharacterized protein